MPIPTRFKTPRLGRRRYRFDHVAAHADIPIVQVDGRIAMARDQTQTTPSAMRGAADRQPAMLVEAPTYMASSWSATRGRPLSTAKLSLPSMITWSSATRLITVASTTRLCSNSCIGSPSASNSAVVGVHVHGAGLNLGVAAGTLETEGAGAGAADTRGRPAAVRSSMVARVAAMAWSIAALRSEKPRMCWAAP